MKRFLLSLCGGLLIPISLFIVFLLSAALFEMTRMDWVVKIAFYSIAWPPDVWEPIFPNSCESCGPTDEAIAATIATDFIFYSLVTYLIQLLIGRLRGGGFGRLWERRA